MLSKSIFVKTLARVSGRVSAIRPRSPPGSGPAPLLMRGLGRWGFAIFPELGELKEEVSKLNTTLANLADEVKAINITLKHIQGLIKNSSTTLEEEVVIAVCDALREVGLELVEVKYNHEFSNPMTGKTACKPDGLILLGDGSWVVVEVGQWVNAGTLSQMVKTTNELTARGHKITHQFVGGPSFKKPT